MTSIAASGRAGKEDGLNEGAGELARLKHNVELGQRDVDNAFERLDDFQRKQAKGSERSQEDQVNQSRERFVLLEQVMEKMSKLNASYRSYAEALEGKLGF